MIKVLDFYHNTRGMSIIGVKLQILRGCTNTVFSSDGVSKLSRYQAIGVPEVWFWEDDTLALYHLRNNGYERIDRSELAGLCDLDLTILKRCLLMGETSTAKAMQ